MTTSPGCRADSYRPEGDVAVGGAGKQERGVPTPETADGVVAQFRRRRVGHPLDDDDPLFVLRRGTTDACSPTRTVPGIDRSVPPVEFVDLPDRPAILLDRRRTFQGDR